MEQYSMSCCCNDTAVIVCVDIYESFSQEHYMLTEGMGMKT